MKKFMISSLLIAAVLLSGCSGSHKIKIVSDERDVFKCPKTAKAGETVQVETVSVTDADLYFYLDGVELKPIKEAYYEFVMPDHDVEINIVIIGNGLA